MQKMGFTMNTTRFANREFPYLLEDYSLYEDEPDSGILKKVVLYPIEAVFETEIDPEYLDRYIRFLDD